MATNDIFTIFSFTIQKYFIPSFSLLVISFLSLHSESECESQSHSVVSNSSRLHGLYSPWNSPGQNTGVGSLSFLQGIFPTQGSNPGLQHCRQILYQTSHKGSPRILEWVAYPFFSGSSQPRNRIGASCIAGGFFTHSTIREAPSLHKGPIKFLFRLFLNILCGCITYLNRIL